MTIWKFPVETRLSGTKFLMDQNYAGSHSFLLYYGE